MPTAPDATDILEVAHPIADTAQSVTVACPYCGSANALNAADWQVNTAGHFIISPVATFGTTCPSCNSTFAFRPLSLADRLPQLPEGLRTELHVVSHKGMTGNKSWVLRDLATDQAYELTPSTVAGWQIPVGDLSSPGIIVTMQPECIALELRTGQLYRTAPPPSSLRPARRGESA
ncbi:putative TraA protein [Stutzerimonas stutzeri B1SMN1]|nr:putative TraA protein [Stutzerimonas stutzeri B1SMN1]